MDDVMPIIAAVVAVLTCGSTPSCSIRGPNTMPPPIPINPAITPAKNVKNE